jgi:hypothetical protein
MLAAPDFAATSDRAITEAPGAPVGGPVSALKFTWAIAGTDRILAIARVVTAILFIMVSSFVISAFVVLGLVVLGDLFPFQSRLIDFSK